MSCKYWIEYNYEYNRGKKAKCTCGGSKNYCSYHYHYRVEPPVWKYEYCGSKKAKCTCGGNKNYCNYPYHYKVEPSIWKKMNDKTIQVMQCVMNNINPLKIAITIYVTSTSLAAIYTLIEPRVISNVGYWTYLMCSLIWCSIVWFYYDDNHKPQ